MYDPNTAWKKDLERIAKAEKELLTEFTYHGFNYKGTHKNGTNKDEHGNSRKYYEQMDDYKILFSSGRIKRDEVKQAGPREERFTHCWKCKKDINNIYMLECIKCGGIICVKCGNCLC